MLHQIGAGVLGPVFRAYQPAPGRLVAVKQFRVGLPPDQAQRFVATLEQVVGADLTHPGIATPIAAGLADTTPYLALDFVAAESFDVVMREYGPGQPRDVVHFAQQLSGALDAAAASGVVHGALHPRDVLMAADDVRMTGLGIAQALEGVGVAAPIRRPYAAPERTAGAPWDRRADIYSLAALTYEMLTGRRVLTAGRASAENLPEIEGADLDRLRVVFARALSDKAADRFEHAREFAEAIERALTPPARGRVTRRRKSAEPSTASELALPLEIELNAPPVAAQGDRHPSLEVAAIDAAFPPPSSEAQDAPDLPLMTASRSELDLDVLDSRLDALLVTPPSQELRLNAIEAAPDLAGAPQPEAVEPQLHLDRLDAEGERTHAARAATAHAPEVDIDAIELTVEPLRPAEEGQPAEPLATTAWPLDLAGARALSELATPRDPSSVRQRTTEPIIDAAPAPVPSDAPEPDIALFADADVVPAAADEHVQDAVPAAAAEFASTGHLELEPDEPRRDPDDSGRWRSAGDRWRDAEDGEAAVDVPPAPTFDHEPPPVQREVFAGAFERTPSGEPTDAPRSGNWPIVLGVALGLMVGFAFGYGIGQWRMASGGAGTASVASTEPLPAAASSPVAAPDRPSAPATIASTPAPADASPSAASSAATSAPPTSTVDKKADAAPAPRTAATAPAGKTPAGRANQSQAASAAAPVEGRLVVRTTPAGSRVVIDGKDAGLSPLTVTLPQGTHVVRLSHQGYVAAERRVRIGTQPAQPIDLELVARPAREVAASPATPERASGTLVLDSRPTGARVFVDEAVVGTTPLTIDAISSGDHKVRFELDGFGPWSTTAKVTAGGKTRVSGSLER